MENCHYAHSQQRSVQYIDDHRRHTLLRGGGQEVMISVEVTHYMENQ